LLWCAGAWWCCQALLACQRGAETAAETSTPSPGATPDTLPALHLADDTPNLLLTWVGEEGDFHVVEKIDAVPAERRQEVRVVLTDRATGTGSSVYVADLTQKRDDGTYAVRTLTRADWEALGADRRKTRMEALAPGQPAPGTPAPGAPAPGAEPAEPGLADPSGAINAIVYGADWCKPCHEAERYLKSLGVSVTKKNIEESRAAQAEMQQKLVRVNRSGAGIPVIDVMGQIFVGYSPGSLKQAVEVARTAAHPKRG
jgi:glutaredoxin